MAKDKKKDEIDYANEAFLREVDEDLRAERQAELWKKYGNTIIGAALAIVLVVAGYQGWKAYDLSSRQDLSQQFAQASDLAKQQKYDEAAKAFSALAAEGGGYGLLARLQEAALLVDKNDFNGAAAAYFEIADDTSVSKIYRDLAATLGVLNGFDVLPTESLRSRLSSLSDEDNPWRHGARELTALLNIREGDKGKARELFDQLAKDATAPSGIRTRAAELASVLER